MVETAGKRAIVFGASGGIGGAVAAQLRQSGDYEVLAGSRSGSADFHFDLTDESSIVRAAQKIASNKPIDLVFVATGLLHRDDGISPEKGWRALDASHMSEVFAVNAIGPALVAKHFLPLLRKDKRVVFAALSARVGSISDNRLGGWHSYRASKAALNMLMKNFALELSRSNPQSIVASLHPGTVDTRLSQPFQRNVAAAKLFAPEECAAALLDVIDDLTPADSGGLFAWDGVRIPF
jgi:NAD(P)-dependent dehydrogenase (short-subunit alcohol dehydrogenase family)